MKTVFECWIDRRPTPKARARVTKFGTYTPKKTRDFEKAIAQELSIKAGKDWPAAGPVEVEVLFLFSPPKSLSMKAQSERIGNPHIQKPDLDNLVKSIKDAMNGILVNDDGQIYSEKSRKAWGPKDQIFIRVTAENL